MYRVLLGKMRERGITQKMLADSIGITERCLQNKLSGNSDFTIVQARAIRNYVAPEMTLDELFTPVTEAELMKNKEVV